MRRSAAFTNMGLAAEPDNSEAPLVTMLKKKGKRIIENADEVVAHLKAAFPWARFNTLDGDAVASMSIKEQVLLLGAPDPHAQAATCVCMLTAPMVGTLLLRLLALDPGHPPEGGLSADDTESAAMWHSSAAIMSNAHFSAQASERQFGSQPVLSHRHGLGCQCSLLRHVPTTSTPTVRARTPCLRAALVWSLHALRP